MSRLFQLKDAGSAYSSLICLDSLIYAAAVGHVLHTRAKTLHGVGDADEDRAHCDTVLYSYFLCGNGAELYWTYCSFFGVVIASTDCATKRGLPLPKDIY